MTETVDLSTAMPLDSFPLAIMIPGKGTPTGWVIDLAGPSHPQTIALIDEVSKEALAREKAIEFAQINGRKWKTDQETADERRRRNVTRVCRRIIGWSPAPTFRQVSHDPIQFSLDAAVNLFLRPDMGSFFVQITDYLNSEAAFMPPSGPT